MLQDDLDEYVKEDEKHKIEIDRLTQEKAKGLEDLQAVTSEVIKHILFASVDEL